MARERLAPLTTPSRRWGLVARWPTWLVLINLGISWAPACGLGPRASLIIGSWVCLLVGLTLASMRPCLRGFAPARCRASSRALRVALTFDDGPDPTSTPRVLEVLERHGARATFFAVGEKARAHPELLRDIRSHGHEVASHGSRHDWRDLLTPGRALAHLDGAVEAIVATLGEAPRFYRPPYGVTTPALGVALSQRQQSLVGWSRRSWDTIGSADAAHRASVLARRLRPGDVVLLHDAPERSGGRMPAGPDMLDRLLEEIARRSFETVTVSELFDAASPQTMARKPS